VKSLPNGTVVQWFIRRGYGFIDVDGEDRDVFVHFSDVKGGRCLRIGDRVEFDVTETYRGLRAENVQLVSE
jgi:CspA family cold shock protein